MTLTLEDVKNVRFPIAKRVGEGYRATEVDDFVDQVDATFGTMIEENERLKAQLDSLDASSTSASGNDELAKENERLKAELARARETAAAPAPVADDAELTRLRQENAELRQQLENSRQSTGLTVMDGNQQGSGRVEKIVVSTAAQASPAVTRLVQLATEQAEAVVTEAETEAQRKLEEANRQAHEVTIDAQTRAERIQSEARVNADQLTAQARANSESLNADVENKRRELFSGLEAERDQLASRVAGLRSFESNFRANMANHLRSQLQLVEQADSEPAEKPELLGQLPTGGQHSGTAQAASTGARSAAGSQPQSGSTSGTPRLDALLAEGRN